MNLISKQGQKNIFVRLTQSRNKKERHCYSGFGDVHGIFVLELCTFIIRSTYYYVYKTLVYMLHICLMPSTACNHSPVQGQIIRIDTCSLTVAVLSRSKAGCRHKGESEEAVISKNIFVPRLFICLKTRILKRR